MGKILISGGFSGTSLMLSLLHRIGLQTGYTDQEVDSLMNKGRESDGKSKGLEYLRDDRKKFLCKQQIFPEVIKHPTMGMGERQISTIAVRKKWDVDYFILCVRNIHRMADIRKKEGHPDWDKNLLYLAERYNSILISLAHLHTNLIIVEFPRYVDDYSYCFDRLNPILTSRRIPEALFKRAFGRTVDPNKVHSR
jgi:hypothetical protein